MKMERSAECLAWGVQAAPDIALDHPHLLVSTPWRDPSPDGGLAPETRF